MKKYLVELTKEERVRLRGLISAGQQLEAEVDQRTELAGVTGSMEDFCGWVRAGLDGATFEQRRRLVEPLVDWVIVTDEEVEIRYVIPTTPESEHVRFCHLRSDYFHHPSTGQSHVPSRRHESPSQSTFLPSLAHSSAHLFATFSGTGLGGLRTTSTLRPMPSSAHFLPLPS